MNYSIKNYDVLRITVETVM